VAPGGLIAAGDWLGIRKLAQQAAAIRNPSD
jgi:hypothetical protein